MIEGSGLVTEKTRGRSLIDVCLCDGCVGCLVVQSYVDEKKMMERERNRLQARKSRTLKKQCTEKLQQQLSQLREQAVRVVFWRRGMCQSAAWALKLSLAR